MSRSERAVPRTVQGWVAAVAGPLAILAAVLVPMRGFAFGGRLSTQHPDVLAYWLPTYCFLGRTLLAGHVPAWNPFALGGVPFAADPQSGWMYVTPTALFTALPCGVAMRWMIVLQPMLAGLGLYAFLRSERVGRAAATFGGLAVAMPLADSRLGLFLPFPAAIAWTMVSLAAWSRYLRASTWPARTAWAVAAAAAWGQLAAAHFAHGLAIGTGALLAYLVARSWRNVRSGAWSVRRAAGLGALLLASLVAVNLAFLLPRLAYLPETSYGPAGPGLAANTLLSPGWPLELATSPGAYLGAAALLLSFAGWWTSRRRELVAAFAAFGAVSYVAGVRGAGSAIGAVLRHVPVLDFYVHFPGRFSLGLLVALPVMAALGFQAWLDEPNVRTRLAMLVPGAVVWFVSPWPLGVHASRMILPGAGLALGAAVLALSARRPALAATLPILLAAELAVNGLAGQAPGGFTLGEGRGPSFDVLSHDWLAPLRSPDVPVAEYLAPGPLAEALRTARGGGRYASLDPAFIGPRGYLDHLNAPFWGLLANQRGMLFGLEDAEGYNPVQPIRTWRFFRAEFARLGARRTGPRLPIAYNAGVFLGPWPLGFDLFDVNWLVGERAHPPVAGAVPLVAEGRWALYRLPRTLPRASVVESWTVVPGPVAALDAVTSSTFDPSRRAVLESSPGTPPARAASAAAGSAAPGTPRGSAAFREDGAGAARVDVITPSPALALVRIPYASGWTATVDGRPAPVLPADAVVLAVPVAPGRHVVRLAYRDPWIGWGIAGSALAVAALLSLGLALGARERRKGRPRAEALPAALRA